MKDDRLIQEGIREEIYAAPATRFALTFIGEANTFSSQRRSEKASLDAGLRFADADPGGLVVGVVRTDALTLMLALDPNSWDLPLTLSGRVDDIVFLGAYV